MLLPDLLENVVELAIRAGNLISEMGEPADLAVSRKTDNSPVSDADHRSHCFLTAELPRLMGLPVLTEESVAVGFEERRDWTTYWLVDPLDGTRHFLRGEKSYSVNIALVSDCLPVLGVVHFPAKFCTYSGAEGAGAQRREKSGAAVPISTKRPVGHVSEGLRVVSSPRFQDQMLSPIMQRIQDRFGDCVLLKENGAIKGCLVAQGAADIYVCPGPTAEWDTAANHAILRAAGGAYLDWNGDELKYNCKPDLINPHFLAVADPDMDWSFLYR